ncbi:MAG: hypothetical protein WDN46_10350 [Methylocella sp.]
MANANVPRGLIPYRRTTGEPFNGAGNIYFIPASNPNNIFIGDPLTYLTNSADNEGIPGVTLATAGSSNNILGAMLGRIPGGEPQVAVTRDFPPFMPANTAGYILVADDPDLLYEVQENGAMVQGAPGRNVNLVAGVGSMITSYSGWMLNSSTLNVTNTLQMKIIRLLEQADNAVGQNAKWLCRINLNALTSTTGV